MATDAIAWPVKPHNHASPTGLRLTPPIGPLWSRARVYEAFVFPSPSPWSQWRKLAASDVRGFRRKWAIIARLALINDPAVTGDDLKQSEQWARNCFCHFVRRRNKLGNNLATQTCLVTRFKTLVCACKVSFVYIQRNKSTKTSYLHLRLLATLHEQFIALRVFKLYDLLIINRPTTYLIKCCGWNTVTTILGIGHIITGL